MARTLTEPEKQDLKKKWGMNSDDPACDELDGTFTYLSKDVANVSFPMDIRYQVGTVTVVQAVNAFHSALKIGRIVARVLPPPNRRRSV